MNAMTPERMLEIVRELKDPADLADRLAAPGVGDLVDLAALTLSFDQRIVDELLRPRVQSSAGSSAGPGGNSSGSSPLEPPSFASLVGHPDVEALGTPAGWYRVRTDSRRRRIGRAAARLGDAALTALHAALADAYQALGRDFDALELYHRVRPGAPSPTAPFRSRFDEADARCELSRCADLIRAVEQVLADETRRWPPPAQDGLTALGSHPLPELRRAKARLSARTQTAEDWFGTLHYFARESLHTPLERLLVAATIGDVAAPWLLHLHAPGGSGKTKLLRWLASRRCAGNGIPVARLDFDAVVRAPDVWEILVEVAEQLDPQLPDRPLSTFLDEVRGAMASLGVGSIVEAMDAEIDAQERAQRERRRAENLPTRLRLDVDVPKRIASLLSGHTTPVVVVIDTLEEAQLRHATDLPRLVEALATVHAACPRLRLVLAGRYDLRAGADRVRGRAGTTQTTHPPRPGGDAASLAARLHAEGVTLEVSPLEGAEAVGYLATRGFPPEDPRLAAVIAKGKGNPLKLALLAEIVAKAPEITAAQIAERADVDLVYLTERVLARVEPELRWIIRYGVVPELITKAFIADVMLPVLAEVLAAEESQNEGQAGGVGAAGPLDDPERDLATALRSLYRPGLFAARVDPVAWAGEVDRLWNRLRDFAGSTSWISTVFGDDDALRFHEVVLEPMRRLVAQRPVHALLTRRATEWLRRRGVERSAAANAGAGQGLEHVPSAREIASAAEALAIKLRAKDVAGAAALWEALRANSAPSPAAALRVAEIALDPKARRLPPELVARARGDLVVAFVALAERGELPADRRKEFIAAVEALDGKRPAKPASMTPEKLRRWALVERYRWNEARAGELLEELARRAPGTAQAVDALVALAELSTTRRERRRDALREALRVATDRPRDGSGGLDRRSKDAIACLAAKALASLGAASDAAALLRGHAASPPLFEFAGRSSVLLARLGLEGTSEALLGSLRLDGVARASDATTAIAGASDSPAPRVADADSRAIDEAVRAPAALVALADGMRRTGMLEQAWRIGLIGAKPLENAGSGAGVDGEPRQVGSPRHHLSLRLAGAQALTAAFDGGAIRELEELLVDAKRIGFIELAASIELAAVRFHCEVSGNLRRAEEHQLAAEGLPIDETSRVARALSRTRLERRLGRWLRNAPDRQDPAALARKDLPLDTVAKVAVESLRRATTQTERTRRAKQLIQSFARIDAPWARAKAAEELSDLEPLKPSTARARRIAELFPRSEDAMFQAPTSADLAWYELRAAEVERTLGDPLSAPERLRASWRFEVTDPLLLLAQFALAARLRSALDDVEAIASRSTAAAKLAGSRLSLPLRLQLLLGVVEHEIAAGRLARIPHRAMSELTELTTQRDAPALAKRRHLLVEAQWHLATSEQRTGQSNTGGPSIAESLLGAARGAAGEDGDERAVAEISAWIEALRAPSSGGDSPAPTSAGAPETQPETQPRAPSTLPPPSPVAAPSSPALPWQNDPFLLPFAPAPALIHSIQHIDGRVQSGVSVQPRGTADAASRPRLGVPVSFGESGSLDDASLAHRGGELFGEAPRTLREMLFDVVIGERSTRPAQAAEAAVVRLEPATPGVASMPWEWALRSGHSGREDDRSAGLIYRAANAMATARHVDALVTSALRTWHARRSPAERKALVGARALLTAWRSSEAMAASLGRADPGAVRVAVEQAYAATRPGAGEPPSVAFLAEDDGALGALGAVWSARGWRAEWMPRRSPQQISAALAELRPDVVVLRGWVRRGLLGEPLTFRVAGERANNVVQRPSRVDASDALDAKALDSLLSARPVGERPLVVLECLDDPTPRSAAEQVVLRNAFAGELFLRGGAPAVLATGGLGVASVQSLIGRYLAEGLSLLKLLDNLWRLDARVEGLELDASWAAANSVLFAHDPLWRPALGRTPLAALNADRREGPAA